MHDPGRQPDLVITDMVLPRMNGREFAKKAVTLLPGMKVIYASGYADTHIVQNGLLARDVNFLQKPYSQQGLARMARTVLDAPAI